MIDREGSFTLLILGETPISLLNINDAALWLGAAAFIILTLRALVERLSAKGQLAGAVILLLSFPWYFKTLPEPAEIVGKEVSVQVVGVGLGMILGMISAIVVLISFYVGRKQGRFPVEETLPNDQRPVVSPSDGEYNVGTGDPSRSLRKMANR